jgi:glycosyltransferase involved in cell wall biosynthesis
MSDLQATSDPQAAWAALRARFEQRAERFGFVVPVYNHARTVRQVALEAARSGGPVWLVDDGSTDGTAQALEGLQGVTVLRHAVNQGKGAALLTGMRAAAEAGVHWVVSVDSDGQHVPAEAVGLLRAASESTRPVIVLGSREGMGGPKVPWTSRWGRRFSNFWVWFVGGPWVSDSQTGFRVYPAREILALPLRARRFQFEVEVLVCARRWGIAVCGVPVSVEYAPPGGRVSHFRPWVDFWRNTVTLGRMFFLRFAPRPALPPKVDSDAP